MDKLKNDSKEAWMKVQETLFSTIERLNPNKKLIELVIEALNSSRSSAYKKINLETKLGFDEILVLIEKFNISFDQHIMNKASPIPFYSDALRKMPEKPIDYLRNLQKHLQFIKGLTNVSYISIAGEVPIFHYMCFKKLFAFKLHVWSFASWAIDRNTKLDLKSKLNDKEMIDAIDNCAHTYYQFSGVEIWNIRMIEITIDQIQYFIPMKAFLNKNDVIEILRELEDFIYHLENICETKTKRFETKEMVNKSIVRIYMNELLHTNEVTIVNSDQGSMLFMAVDTPNFVRTSDTRMIKHIDNWIHMAINHSTQVSGEGQKERRIMFENVLQRFYKGKQEILNLLNIYYPEK